MSTRKGPHHRGSHQVRAKAITDAAKANPATRCWRCGRTMTEIRKTKPRAIWHAGHLKDGQIGGPYRAECSPCNTSAGARKGNALRGARRRRFRTSRDW